MLHLFAAGRAALARTPIGSFRHGPSCSSIFRTRTFVQQHTSGSDLRAAAHFRLGPSCNSILPGFMYMLSLAPRSKRYIECCLLFQYHQRRCDLFHASLISLFLGSWPFSPIGICTAASRASETLKKSGPKYNSPGLVWAEASGISMGERRGPVTPPRCGAMFCYFHDPTWMVCRQRLIIGAVITRGPGCSCRGMEHQRE